MILNDSHIRELDGTKAISYGTGSYGYDIRLSPKEFRVFKATGKTINPKAFDPYHTEAVTLEHDDYGAFFTIPAYRYALGVAMERLAMPPDVTARVLLKSTYQRMGLAMSTGKVNASWFGHLTLEFFNAAPDKMRIYAGEGVAHLEFHRSEIPVDEYTCTYEEQGEGVVFGGVS